MVDIELSKDEDWREDDICLDEVVEDDICFEAAVCWDENMLEDDIWDVEDIWEVVLDIWDDDIADDDDIWLLLSAMPAAMLLLLLFTLEKVRLLPVLWTTQIQTLTCVNIGKTENSARSSFFKNRFQHIDL